MLADEACPVVRLRQYRCGMATRAPQMSIGEFEELARAANRIAEGLRLESLAGKLSAKQPPDGNHGCIIEWLIRRCLSQRPELWLSTTQGLLVGADRTGRVRPDGTLADTEAFVGQGEWASAQSVLMVVEVASHGEDTIQRHRIDLPRAYAASGIPIYLLVDRDAHKTAVYSSPSAGRYQNTMMTAFGVEVPLPEPVGFTLNTAPLAQWALPPISAAGR
ncbi:Uma2 family endonuclease [Nocardia sp. NPDC051052]|uniref:Uma2 family endonuclease n=1 Tax=Nocardia sp. NPDC051052 TaxID=3364322 RepID=UPI0037BC4AA8